MPARIDIDLRKLDKAIKRAEKAGIDLRPAFRKLRTPLRKDQREHMRAQSGPGGKWPNLAPSTRAKRLKMGGVRGALTKKGKLRKGAKRKLNFMLSSKLLKGAKIKVRPKSIEIRSKVKWAGIHQEGGRAGRGAQLPARTFMWISDELGRRAVALFREHLASAFNGKKL